MAGVTMLVTVGKDDNMASKLVRARDRMVSALLPATQAHAQSVCKGCQRYSYVCGADLILHTWIWTCMWVEDGSCCR
jgi:hypothetical protein